MIGSAYGTGYPGTLIGGVPAMGYSGVPMMGAGLDLDPISPGIQNQRGVLTPTGPPVMIPNGSMMGMGNMGIMGNMGTIGASGYANQGLMASGYQGIRASGIGAGFGAFGSVVDADPLTPGIQAQPGIVTQTGPSVVVGGPGMMGGALSGGFGTSVTTSGVTGYGANALIGNTAVMGNTAMMGNTGFIGGAVIDADPVTPGIQAQPGLVTQAGPSQIIGNVNAGMGGLAASGLGVGGYGSNVMAYRSGVYGSQGYRNCACCPWWLWTILCLLLLVALLSGLYYFAGPGGMLMRKSKGTRR